MKLQLFTIISIALFLTSISIAEPVADAKKCPSVPVIQQTGLDTFIPGINKGEWNIGQSSSKYDTSDLWSFGFEKVSAPDLESAKVLANAALKTLQPIFSKSPVCDNSHCTCAYMSSVGMAYAISAASLPIINVK